MKLNIKKICTGAVLLSGVSVLYVLASSYPNMNIETSSELMLDSENVHDWNSENYSMSELELKEFFDRDILNNPDGESMVVFYDGGECNPYMSTVISEMESVPIYNKVLITNCSQSYIDSNLRESNSTIKIIGDESRYLAKLLNKYDSDIDRAKSEILFYYDGECKYSDVYTPRLNGEFNRVIDKYKKVAIGYLFHLNFLF